MKVRTLPGQPISIEDKTMWDTSKLLAIIVLGFIMGFVIGAIAGQYHSNTLFYEDCRTKGMATVDNVEISCTVETIDGFKVRKEE